MGSVSGASSISLEKAVADLFFADGGFSFSDDAAAYQRFSQNLSKLVGRPVVVVNLADLPHANPTPQDMPSFSPDQLAERAKKLLHICRATFPDEPHGIWEKGNMVVETAKYMNPNLGSVLATRDQKLPLSLLPSRVVDPSQTNVWNYANIMLLSDRRWPEKALWAHRIGFEEEKIGKYPSGDGSRFLSFFHEMSHILQLGCINDNTPNGIKWNHEGDADKGAVDFATMVANDPRCPTSLSRSIRLAVALKAPVRALERFLQSPGHYGTALAIDAHLNGRQAPTFEHALEVEEELRWRAYDSEKGHGKLLSARSDSDVVHNTTRARRENMLRDTTLAEPIKDACDLCMPPASRELYLRSLFEVMASHPVTDPDTIREGGLVLRAAKFFRPSLFSSPQPSLQLPKIEVLRRAQVSANVRVMQEMSSVENDDSGMSLPFEPSHMPHAARVPEGIHAG